MFDGIDTEHLLICELNPYISDLGKLFVSLYISTTKLIDFCQTVNPLYEYNSTIFF